MSDREEGEGKGKRSAVSPLQEEEGKRMCFNTSDISFLGDETDQETTILTETILASTPSSKAVRVMSGEEKGVGETKSSLREEIRSALTDPQILGQFSSLVSKAVVAQVTAEMKKEIQALQVKLKEKDNEIRKLTNKVDDLEQYTRRNSVRINSIPESDNENTSQLVCQLAKAVGANLPENAIDRSHRVGPKNTAPNTSLRDRAIIVKFTSFQHKLALVSKRKELRKKTGEDIFPDLYWPLSAPASSPRTAGRHFVYVNDDLTAVRAQVFRKARQLKKNSLVADTWTRDGFIFVKISKDGTPFKISTLSELEVLARDLHPIV